MSFYGLNTYELIKEERIEDVGSTAFLLRHKKSGARLVLLSNEDDNKVFYIGFRTPPEDETGVPHIIEHTVLCGSYKFPVKDPFVELAKGSLNTFLNAMTWPDKTVYPVASYNDRDFKNLMDVYMDAVLHPNILKFEEIFKQEGWHYELESPEGPLTINGVVYNEMKGAYSSPEEMLQDCLYQSQFPDNTYGKNSGGNPDHIPELSYEAYLDFYKKYYHPSNSYIYLYGDFDIAERLQWLDEAYLSEYDSMEVDSEIKKQPGFAAVKEVNAYYPISSEESEENNTYLAYSRVIGESTNKNLCQAMEVLDYCLVSAPGAPVYQALIDAGIAQDVYGSFDSGTLQPTYTIVAKNANAEDKERFVEIIESTLRKVIEEGINEESVLAAINSSEFHFREADYGRFPKGLFYGLSCLDSWLFDENDPFLYLKQFETFAFLKEQYEKGYYEELIREYFLNNTHGAVVCLEPKKGLNQEKEAALEKKLAEKKAEFSKEELEVLVEDTRHLKEYQSTPSSEEDMAKLPMLERSDLRKEAEPFHNIEETLADTKVVRHEYFTNGIDYISLYFDVTDIPLEEVPYVNFLRNILAYVDTDSYSYGDLANIINIMTGGISTGVVVDTMQGSPTTLRVQYEVRVKTLEDHLEDALEIVREILMTSCISDTKRLAEIIAQTKSRLQSSLSSAGHVVAAYRSLSYSTKTGYYQDAANGISYNEAVCAMDSLIKENPKQVAEHLQALIEKIFCRSRLLVSFTGEEASFKNGEKILTNFIKDLPEGAPAGEAASYVPEQKNEAFTDASAIQYVARAGNFVSHGLEYKGALRVLDSILSYEYMWLNIRVKGGAYGCMCNFAASGEAIFTSYRDPNLRGTNEVYEGIPAYVENFTADEKEMTKYIIGTLGSMDKPLNPEAKGVRSMRAYIKGQTLENTQKIRDEILSATDADIRGLSNIMKAILSDGNICVIGNENTIRKEREMFHIIRPLNE